MDKETIDATTLTYEKLIMMLKSGAKDNIALAMTILKTEHPAMWVSLIGFSGEGVITEGLVLQLAKSSAVSVGSVAKYRGMKEGPEMVITDLMIKPTKSIVKTDAYCTMVTCKYFNRSNQSFMTIQDRLECFEILSSKPQ